MRALQTETVPQVRRLLLQVLDSRQRADHGTADVPSAAVLSAPETAEPSGSAQLDIASLIRHELAPAVGWIRLAADSEISSFGQSKTNGAVRKLQRRIDGLVAIIKSSEELNLKRFSLPHVLLENWPDAHSDPAISPRPDEKSIDIVTDEGLFSVLISNVFQNALDASRDAQGDASVQISWGYTERNYWVRVTNPFRGDRLSLADVAPVGSSSKMAHQGQGLALIQTVASRLELAVNLEGASGTASFSLSGTRPDA